MGGSRDSKPDPLDNLPWFCRRNEHHVRVTISRDIRPYTVPGDAPIRKILERLEATKLRVVLVVESDGTLIGTVSDGDFRRWVMSQPDEHLETLSRHVANKNSVSASVQEDKNLLGSRLSSTHPLIPLVDPKGHVIAVAFERTRALDLGDLHLTEQSASMIVAEIGVNHNGDLGAAQDLVDAGLEAGADCVKFQMRDMASLYRTNTNSEDLGAEYTLDLLRETSLSQEEIIQCLEYARSQGAITMCTPWDISSVAALAEFEVDAIKIASADLTNHPLIEAAARTGIPLILSTGMSTEEEIKESVHLLTQWPIPFALLHCNSAYPPADKDINLRYLARLANIGDCLVGYSGHERGIHIPVAAVALGARIIEKHITLDRSMRGNDHKISLEPTSFRDMCRAIRSCESALGTDNVRRLTQGEQLNRLSLAKSLVASRDLEPGTVITREDVDVLSPGRGLQPNRILDLVGAVLPRRVERHGFFYETDIEGIVSRRRNFDFDRPWGIPVRFHDWPELAEGVNVQLLEFHLSYRDLQLDPTQFLTPNRDLRLVVHSPDLFENDHILDLAAADARHWSQSITHLQNVIILTRKMAPYFADSHAPIVVASLGGSTLDGFVSAHERRGMYARVRNALDQIDTSGIRLMPQSLPPLPWYLGGQRYCNLFVDPKELAEFATTTQLSLCLDLSHTRLACNFLDVSFSDAIRQLAPLSDHLHIVDAAGVDDEGLQIGEGEIDWIDTCRLLNEFAPNVSFIPEIWQGHNEHGRGFWTALAKLERYFQSTPSRSGSYAN